MQNLSFKSTVTVKPVEEVTKNNVVASKTNQNSSNAQEDVGAQNSFQSLLNKQVQSKRGAESAAAKSVNKPPSKASESPQKNHEVDERAESNVSANSAGDVHRANIDELVARLNALRPEGEGKHGDLATEEVAEEDEAEAEAFEEVAALANAVNNLQPQEMMAQALVRAQFQSTAHSDHVSQEGQLNSEAMTLASDSVHKELSAATLNNALSEGVAQPIQGEQFVNGADRWKDVFSEKMTLTDSLQDGNALGDVLKGELNSKNLQSLDSALKFLDSEKAKEGFSQETAKDLNTTSGLPAQSLAQQATTPSTQAMTQVGASNQIMAYPGRTGWNQEISQKVVWMVGNGEQSATLTLNPPDLGPVQVVINVNNNQADAAFFSDNADVRQALEDGLEYLRESMASSGLQLGQANINAGQQSQQGFQEMAQRQFADTVKSPQATIGADLPAVGMTIRESQGLVDTFA